MRPIGFSGKTFRRLPEDLQKCVLEAGKAAGKHGREIESSQDSAKLAKMESEGKLKTHKFADRAKLLELAEPVKKAYAAELGATDVLEQIMSIK